MSGTSDSEWTHEYHNHNHHRDCIIVINIIIIMKRVAALGPWVGGQPHLRLSLCISSGLTRESCAAV